MSLFDDLPEPSAIDGALTENTNDLLSENISKASSVNVIPLISTFSFLKGERPEMQDAHVCIDDLTKIFNFQIADEVFRLSYFAVFDGHAGSRAAVFASKQLHRHLAVRIPKGGISQIEKDIRRVLIDSYKKTDEGFLREACQGRPHWRDGSTAASVLLINNTLYVANLGDSKVVLARNIDSVSPEEGEIASNGHNGSKATDASLPPLRSNVAALCLTRSHNPVDYEERQRIQATGANVHNGRVNGILEVSRSFGDYQFKKQGVTCIPDVVKCVITPQDRFLIIACDGLWKSFPPDEAVALADRLLLKEVAEQHNQRMPHGTSQDSSTSSASVMPLTHHQVDAVCLYLTNEAVLRMSGDNVTCLLIVFPEAYNQALHVPTNEVEKKEQNEPPDTDTNVEPPSKLPRTSK